MNTKGQVNVSVQDELRSLIHARIESLRPKLLDLSRNNPLVSTRLSSRSNSYIRVVDELPDVLFFGLSQKENFRFKPLPSLEDDPKDEENQSFQVALSAARLTDAEYAKTLEDIDPADEDAAAKERKAERALRDRVREQRGMAPRQTRNELSLAQHARNNGISPSYDLPYPEEEHGDGRHRDDAIQTLLLPDDLERTANRLISKCRSWQQETGLNVLHGAFGFLEWVDPASNERSLSPLILVPIKIERKKTKHGPEFWIEGTGEPGERNTVLAEKLRREFNVELPAYERGSIENYLSEVSEAAPPKLEWKVRRFVAFGVFPSARLAMYHDLDTKREGFSTNDTVNELLAGKASGSASPFADEYPVDSPEIEAKVPLLVTDADSSQFSTIVDLMDGKNLAVEGPPGTGKSQTIINTIAAALAEGKKILFVAEKMAALDVVRARLEHMGLGEFILPLLADRSSREQVIRSIKGRIEMKSTPAPVDYEEQKRKFRETRDEIARYIDVVSQEYRSTGFTIHQILGRSMLTGQHLDGTPRSFQSPNIPKAENFDQHRIKTVKEEAAILEEAHRKATEAAPYWAGLQYGPLDRFTVDDLLNRSEEAAALYRKAWSARGRLASFSIPEGASPEAIERLRLSLIALFEKLPSIDASLVIALAQKDQVQALKELLKLCEMFREQHNSLALVLEGPFDRTLASQLHEILRICEESGFDTLDLNILKEHHDAFAASIRKGEEAERELATFLKEVPYLADYTITTLVKARRLFKNVSHDVLLLRNGPTADPQAAPLIERGIATARTLRWERDALAGLFGIESIPSAGEISHHVAALRSAGFFGVFSSEYRAAKRAYKRLSKNRGFRKGHALEELDRLARWKKEEERFLTDQQMRTVFSLHFQGIDTDFERFALLLSFYRSVDQSFPRLDQREIRKFLKTAEIDLLYSVPSIEVDRFEGTHREFAEEQKRRCAELTRIENGIAQLEGLVQRIKDIARARPDNLAELAQTVAAHAAKRETIESSPLRVTLGERFAGVETEAEPFVENLAAAEILFGHKEWSGVLCSLLGENRIGDTLVAVNAFAGALQEAQAALDELSRKTGIPNRAFLLRASFEAIVAHLEAASKDREGLILHAAFFGALRDIKALGFGGEVQDLLAEGGDLENLPDKLEAMIVRALSMRIYMEHGSTLGRFSGQKLDGLRSRLAALDKKIVEMSRRHLRAKLVGEAKPRGGNGIGRKSEWTEMALLYHEIGKQRGHPSVRDLTRRAGRALLELKPCWMTSPLSIAQYLESGTAEFDLCIIDEASQMPPENAIGVLLRAKQVMIVGDTNQLPPTSFFRKMIADDDTDEDETVLEESILEMANATFRPQRRLRWHYRSRHSGLIRFSNRMIYEDDLIVFPSATEHRKDMGVSLRRFQGLYKAGTNPAEAKAMVEAAIRFMRDEPHRSLGIVTLNQKQRDLIEEELRYALDHDSKAQKYIDYWENHRDGLERFFVKNLENVQGDERDVIFVGTVYGPEQPGAKVFQRFGPINGVAGKRRLNVLFSRAKEQIVTFSSMTAADITADEHGNPGAYMLKRWLEYAATGILDAGETPPRSPDSDFENYVARQIMAMGCEVVHQVGVAGYFIDIGVKHPDWPHGFLLGVECDGATWHSSKSARDRDRLRQEVLEGLGWHFHRVWSTDWFNDPRAEAAKLRRRIEERLAEAKAKEPTVVVLTVSDRPSAEHRPTSDNVMFDEDIEGDVEKAPDLFAFSQARRSMDGWKDTGIDVGDTVRVRYLDGDQATLLVTLSDERNDPSNGIIHVGQPLGKALIDAEEGDEVEVLVGPRVRLAKIEEVRKVETA